MDRPRSLFFSALCALVLAVGLTACGGDDDEGGGGEAAQTQQADTNVSGSVQVSAVWTGDEQKNFQAVLDGFEKKFPNASVRYNAAGDQLPTVLATAVEGGNPPDIAVVAQPGLARDFVQRGALKPLDFAEQDLKNNFNQDWIDLGTFDDKLYGLPFKGANKSTIWFNTQTFEDAGVEPPGTWEEFLETAETIKASGVAPFSIGGSDGWTLTDLFENIYLRTAGPEKYDQLAEHEIKWTDESVKNALTEMKKVVGEEGNLPGNPLQTSFDDSVTQVFGDQPKAAQVIEGDFVGGVIRDQTNAQEGDYDVYPFPSIGESGENVVMGGGDMVVMFKDSPAAQALIRYLASAEAAEIWARRGGFSSPNKNVDPSVYPDELTRKTAEPLAEAETFRFDLSDLVPASFGATEGQGMWKTMQDFVQSGDVDRTAQTLERQAARAFDRDADRGTSE